MAAKKAYQQILINVAIGVLVIVVASAIFGVLNVFLSQNEQEAEQRHMKEDIKELKENIDTIKKNITTVREYQIKTDGKIDTLIVSVDSLKAQLQSAYTKNIEQKKAKLRTELQNNLIASNL